MDHGNIFELIAENPKVFTDERGSMSVLYENGDILVKRSHSKPGVFRGLHFQTSDSPQVKLVRVISGKVLDLAVDPVSGKARTRTLTPSSDWVIIGQNLAHGFYAVEETVLEYVCHGKYSSDDEKTYSILPFLADMGISDPIISAKDLAGEALDITDILYLDKGTR